jgi:hypothetical protein
MSSAWNLLKIFEEKYREIQQISYRIAVDKVVLLLPVLFRINMKLIEIKKE